MVSEEFPQIILVFKHDHRLFLEMLIALLINLISLEQPNEISKELRLRPWIVVDEHKVFVNLSMRHI